MKRSSRYILSGLVTGTLIVMAALPLPLFYIHPEFGHREVFVLSPILILAVPLFVPFLFSWWRSSIRLTLAVIGGGALIYFDSFRWHPDPMAGVAPFVVPLIQISIGIVWLIAISYLTLKEGAEPGGPSNDSPLSRRNAYASVAPSEPRR